VKSNGANLWLKIEFVCHKKNVFKILPLLPPILLCGCVGIVFGIYVGCYSRIDLTFVDAETFAVDKSTAQKEADKTLEQLNFKSVSVGTATTRYNIESAMSYRENLFQTNCVAEWLQEKQSFWWGGQDCSVQMFIETNAISFVTITDEQGSKKEVKEIQAVLAKMVGDEFPNIKTNMIFRSLRTAMPP
jgi:hypothetical protein